MQNIVPHLWFDTQALEAAAFYTSVFPDSAILHKAVLKDTPTGDCDIVSFKLWGQPFEAISAGPQFTINPSISFIVNFDPLLFGEGDKAKTAAREAQQALWDQLADGGKVMMPLDSYPFSERFGFVQDKFGVSWQLMLTRPEGDPRPPIVPAMLFTDDNCGKAEAARAFYLSVFNDSQAGGIQHYGPGQEPNVQGSVMFSDFMIENTWIAAMDGGGEHGFGFNEGVSFMLLCDSQGDIDYYWDRLNPDPDSGQCGWLKDRFGVSWQVLPYEMSDMIFGGSEEQLARLMAAAMPMKRLDLRLLQKAFKGDD